MRHKYQTLGVILSRKDHGEANVLVSILTPELGLVRARVQGVRKSGAKLATGITTLAISSCTLVRGKEGWRLVGALNERNDVRALSFEGREVLGRVAFLIDRLVKGESRDARLFTVFYTLLNTLCAYTGSEYEPYEYLAVLYILSLQGVEGGEGLGNTYAFTEDDLKYVREHSREVISRINTGIHASGL
ncbi:MAG: recombination protein O N-terminal domain-containing protein [Candidatus Pacebacteria bacterium]|nr:recombination protein O N-terminal domain-containing protein [Candidatus Paceibacterota bacterium]